MRLRAWVALAICMPKAPNKYHDTAGKTCPICSAKIADGVALQPYLPSSSSVFSLFSPVPAHASVQRNSSLLFSNPLSAQEPRSTGELMIKGPSCPA